MVTDLRSQVVEAMAQASYGCDDWDELHADDKQIWRDGAEAALDAALDVLGERFAGRSEVSGLMPVMTSGKAAAV